jgi:hypothetical protein
VGGRGGTSVALVAVCDTDPAYNCDAPSDTKCTITVGAV